MSESEASEEAEDPEEVTDGAGTTTAAYRNKYLSTVVTILVILAYSALVLGEAFGATAGTVDGGTWATFSLAFVAVIAYSVGVDTLKAAADVRGGNS